MKCTVILTNNSESWKEEIGASNIYVDDFGSLVLLGRENKILRIICKERWLDVTTDI